MDGASGDSEKSSESGYIRILIADVLDLESVRKVYDEIRMRETMSVKHLAFTPEKWRLSRDMRKTEEGLG